MKDPVRCCDLPSLVPLQGFVSENPTAPIQLVRRRAPPCLNEFCRLGCVCSSLAHSCRIGHCGRARCMFGCSCLKQKVVLLKNLDGSDSGSSHHGSNKKRKRRRRMKMAYSKQQEEPPGIMERNFSKKILDVIKRVKNRNSEFIYINSVKHFK